MARTPTPTATLQDSANILITWQASGYYQVQITVSKDNGGYNLVTNLYDSDTGSYLYNASDTANHKYVFKIKGGYIGTGYDDVSLPSNAVYGALSAPSNVTIRPKYTPSASPSNPNAYVTVENECAIATKVQYQTSAYDPSGEPYWVGDGESSDIYSFMVFSQDGKWFRFRNYAAEDAVSDWFVVQDAFWIARQPQKPTFVSYPTTVNINDRYATIKWKYNAVDNSTQKTYQFDYSLDGFSTVAGTITGGTDEECVFDVTDATDEPCVISYRVRTTSSSDYPTASSYSDTMRFIVAEPPTISNVTPSAGATITAMPLLVNLDYHDMVDFTYATILVSIYRNGILLGTKTANNSSGTGDSDVSMSFRFTSDEIGLENGDGYSVVANARSTSGLSTSVTQNFSVSFAEPIAGSLQIADDIAAGYTELTVSYDNTGAVINATSVSVFRMNGDNTRTLLLSDVMSGASVIDKYAPLNAPYRYAVVTKAESGATHTEYFEHTFHSSRAFFYFGDDMASAMWQQTPSDDYSRPHQEEFYFSGRELPVLVDDEARSLKGTVGFTVMGKDEIDAFKRLMSHSGSVVYKSTDGLVIHAKVSVKINRRVDTVSYDMYLLTVNFLQVDGVQL